MSTPFEAAREALRKALGETELILSTVVWKRPSDAEWITTKRTVLEEGQLEAITAKVLAAAEIARWRPATKADWESCAEFEIIWARPGSGCWAGPSRGMLHEDVPDGDDIIVMIAEPVALPDPPKADEVDS